MKERLGVDDRVSFLKWKLKVAVLSLVLAFCPSFAQAVISATELTVGSDPSQLLTYTTASISPGANRLVLAWVLAGNNSATTPATLTGNGLNWVQIATVLWDTTATPTKSLTLFRAMGASPATGSVSITFPIKQRDAAWTIVEFSGVDTSGTDGSGAIVQSAVGSNDSAGPSGLTLTLSQAIGSGNATAGSFGNNSGALSISTGAGYTAFTEASVANPPIDLRGEWRANGNTTVDVTQSGSFAIAGIAVEIKAIPVPSLVKQVWLPGGTSPLALSNSSPSSVVVPAGTTLVFLIYVKNISSGLLTDLRFLDLLDVSASGFSYVPNSLVRTSAVSPPLDTDSDLTIFNATAPAAGTALTDAVDGDVASICDSTAGSCPGAILNRITVGNTSGLTPVQANGTLAVAAHTTFAIRFQAVKP